MFSSGKLRRYRVIIPLVLVFFYITTVSLHYYGNQPASNMTTAQTKNSIRQALQQIPVCMSDDRARQRDLLYTLQAWSQFAHQHSIRYWITSGTLVGYVQRRGLLPHDQNVDVSIMAQDTSHLFERSQLTLSSIYKVKVHPQWYIVGYTNRSYFRSENIDFLAPNARFIDLKNKRVHLDIWPVYDYHPGKIRMENNSVPMLTEYGKYYEWKSLPKQWTFPLQECLFSGIKVWCPAQPKKLVASVYGERSVSISAKKCVNGSWVQSDEYELAEKVTTMKDESSSTEQTIYSDTTSTILTDSDLIEKALEDIPVCASDDRLRQNALLTSLQAWSKLAEKYNIKYWLTFGTLIGYVQRRGLLPHDFDIDVTMMSGDTLQLINITQYYLSSTYKLKIQPQWNIVGYENRTYFRKQGINFVAPNARLVNLDTDFHVDIFPSYNFNPLDSTDSTEQKQSDNLTVYDPDYKWVSYPRSWTYPLKTCYFSRIKVLCPAEPEKLVALMYGSGALTKSDTKCINGSWVEDS